MPTTDFIADFTQQCLTSPLLSTLPLLFSTGQTVYHRDLGICTVLECDGARRRLVAYRRIHYQNDNEATGSMWVNIGALEEMEMRTQLDLQGISPEDLDMTRDQ